MYIISSYATSHEHGVSGLNGKILGWRSRGHGFDSRQLRNRRFFPICQISFFSSLFLSSSHEESIRKDLDGIIPVKPWPYIGHHRTSNDIISRGKSRNDIASKCLTFLFIGRIGRFPKKKISQKLWTGDLKISIDNSLLLFPEIGVT